MILRNRLLGVLYLAAALCPGVYAGGVGNEQVTAGPLPNWFNLRSGLDLATESRSLAKEGISSTGMEFLFLDRQVDVASATRTTHIAYRITSQAGLAEGTQISHAFDPSFESFTYHFIRLWRNGQAQDRLKLAEIKVLH